MLRYDLHTHSTASDGALSPLALVERARERGVEVLALTDHDTVAGVQALQGQMGEMTLVNGAELTCLWGSRMVHIVGLGLDIDCESLLQYLEAIDLLRQQRAEQVASRLMKKGLPDLLADARANAAGGVIGRPHFASAMVERGLVKTEQQAFSQYLGSGKTGDVKMQWPDMSEAISVIAEAGGLAVLAHPTKYRFTFTKIRELLGQFKADGGHGMEVSYTGISPSHQLELIKLANKHELLVSAGSDFHSPVHHWTEIGRFMPIKQSVDHIIDHLL